MTTVRRQLILTLAVGLAGGAVMLATANTFNPGFCCVASQAYGWPFPWETIDSHHSGPGIRHPADYWAYNFAILLVASFFIGRCVRGRSVVRPTLTVIAILTVAPLVATALLFCCTPDRGELLYPVSVATFVFGGFRALWPTYIPVLIVVPFVMKRIASRHDFSQVPVVRLLRQAALIGAIGGACVMVPRAIWTLFDGGNHFLFVVGLSACAVSGAITLALICLLYRYGGSPAEPGAPPNGGLPGHLELRQPVEGRHR